MIEGAASIDRPLARSSRRADALDQAHHRQVRGDDRVPFNEAGGICLAVGVLVFMVGLACFSRGDMEAAGVALLVVGAALFAAGFFLIKLQTPDVIEFHLVLTTNSGDRHSVSFLSQRDFEHARQEVERCMAMARGRGAVE